LCDNIHHEQAHSHFNHSLDKSKLFLVEHDAKPAVDAGTWSKDIITLRKLNYKGADSTSVNPHYFGEVNITPKNQDITNFIMVGKLGTGQSDNSVIINAALQLLKDEITNFKITVVGKGDLDGLPPELAQRVDIKGRLPFDAMFAELEKADFMLTSYKGPQHDFYRTTGASGNFQLVFGFAKPCIIIDDFAGINGFNNDNAIVYKAPTEYADAMKKAISMSPAEYNVMQSKLAAHAAELRRSSLQNLSELIERRSALTK
jgi:glycosyltransferase involved in cell wall biosynthesis